jgi:hypothetical protein
MAAAVASSYYQDPPRMHDGIHDEEASGPSRQGRMANEALEQLQDLLHSRGASNELVDDWRRAEEAELKSARGKGVPPRSRQIALQVLGDSISLLGLDFDSFFENISEAVLVFDMLSLQASEQEELAVASPRLLITCVSIFRLLEKANRRKRWCQFDAPLLLSRQMERFRNILESDGRDYTNIDNQTFNRREIEVLKVLGMRLARRPSVYDWLTIMGKRTVEYESFYKEWVPHASSILTHRAIAPKLHHVFRSCQTGWMALVPANPVSQDLAPQRIAVGLFTLSLSCVGVLPIDLLRPAKIAEEDWARMLRNAPLQGDVGMVHSSGPPGLSPCFPPATYSDPVLQILQIASRSSMEELQAHAFAVLAAFQTAVEEGDGHDSA